MKYFSKYINSKIHNKLLCEQYITNIINYISNIYYIQEEQERQESLKDTVDNIAKKDNIKPQEAEKAVSNTTGDPAKAGVIATANAAAESENEQTDNDIQEFIEIAAEGNVKKTVNYIIDLFNKRDNNNSWENIDDGTPEAKFALALAFTLKELGVIENINDAKTEGDKYLVQFKKSYPKSFEETSKDIQAAVQKINTAKIEKTTEDIENENKNLFNILTKQFKVKDTDITNSYTKFCNNNKIKPSKNTSNEYIAFSILYCAKNAGKLDLSNVFKNLSGVNAADIKSIIDKVNIDKEEKTEETDNENTK